MSWLHTLILAIVEGLTEFLPVSSTGHMIIAQGLMGMESTPFSKAFTVIIQFGAILSVVCLYWRRFFYPDVVRERGGAWWDAIWPFYLKLIIGVLPAVVVGLTLNDFIDRNLGSIQVTATMLVVGGVFMLFCDRLFNNEEKPEVPLTYRRALIVGLYQCIAAVLPGTSRSMATIVGGMQQRLTRKAAAEFSFFLAVPTMFGATVLETYKLIKHDGNLLTQGDNLTLLLVGSAVAFVVSIAAIKFFIGYITRYGFRAFGWYRIVVGLCILGLPLSGVRINLDTANAAADNTANVPSTSTPSSTEPTPAQP